MATEKQKTAARENIKKAQRARTRKAPAAKKAAAPKKAAASKSAGLSTAQRDRMSETKFAFPKERKEPLNDARHVRNAIARFDQVEDVSDAERDRAWKRIKTAAKKFDVEIEADGWRELFSGGKSRRR
ncbi:MAG: hypothetical protein QOJ74_426 [Ilumatobacteraceae bacterium]|jgi:hypothetical protein|nr:hypothetical protein [Ilumatobacteraceae bacterium]